MGSQWGTPEGSEEMSGADPSLGLTGSLALHTLPGATATVFVSFPKEKPEAGEDSGGPRGCGMCDAGVGL